MITIDLIAKDKLGRTTLITIKNTLVSTHNCPVVSRRRSGKCFIAQSRERERIHLFYGEKFPLENIFENISSESCIFSKI